MLIKLFSFILLLSSTPARAIEQCQQECGKDKYTNVDARLLCEQLCKLNLNLETAVDNEVRLNLLATELMEQRREITELKKKEAYVADITSAALEAK